MPHPEEEPKPAGSTSYAFDNRAPETPRRFAALSQIFDPWTIRHLEHVGVNEGWQCLEVGAGGGSIARWLASRVGPSGRVLATDIDARHLDGLGAANLEVRQHDVSNDPLPATSFDLVHTRLVLQHVPGRRKAISKLVRSLKPGGWMVLEDFAANLWLNPLGQAEGERLHRKTIDAFHSLLRSRGADPYFGRKLIRALEGAGIQSVEAELYGALWRGASPGAELSAANYEQLRGEYLERGLLTADELDRLAVQLHRQDHGRFSPILLTAWGRKPGG